MSVAQADGDAGFDWSEPFSYFRDVSEDERLSELAFQSERLAGKTPTRSAELLEDDVRYLTQEVGELEAELDRWLAWHESAPELGDEGAAWSSWYASFNGRWSR